MSVPQDGGIGWLTAGLHDPEARVRAAAARVIGAHASRTRYERLINAQVSWRTPPLDVGAFVELLYRAVRFDTDWEVRLDSLIALGASEFRAGFPVERYPLSKRLIDTMVEAYDAEPTARVRTEIVKSVALADNAEPAALSVLLSALDDPSPAVVRAGVYGVSTRGLLEATRELSRLLSHADTEVRGAAAEGLARYGRAAIGEAASLRDALAKESDEVTKSKLRVAINAVERGGR